jgi:hypothetical protein
MSSTESWTCVVKVYESRTALCIEMMWVDYNLDSVQYSSNVAFVKCAINFHIKTKTFLVLQMLKLLFIAGPDQLNIYLSCSC